MTITKEKLAKVLLESGLTPFSYMPSNITSNTDEWDTFRLKLSAAILDKLDIREKE